MSDSTMSNRDERMDRYARRELTAVEAREFAQESLDDPDLFDDLTYSALAKAALSERSVAGGKVVRFPRKVRFAAVAAALAAALVLVSLYSLRPSFWRRNQPPVAQNQPQQTAASPRLKPALVSAAQPGQPVLLASGLQPDPAGRSGTQIFRGTQPDSRSPRRAGSIVSIEDGVAAVDLGSLDGLAKGSELGIFRDQRSTLPIGRLTVTTVFRERARGRIVAAEKVQVNSQVRIADAVYLGALLEQVDALSNRGDSDGARRLAEQAVEWAKTATVPPGQSRKALERLAALEYQAGSLQAAERDYQSAVDIPSRDREGAVEPSSALNNLAVLHMLRGDYDGAEAPLRQAVSISSHTNVAYGRSVNNLGVLAEWRGDRRKAAEFYQDAQRAFAGGADATAQDRKAVETNLARTRGVR